MSRKMYMLTSTVNNPKHFDAGWEPDHEFPWIETKDDEIRCCRCGEVEFLLNWRDFLEVHALCKK